MWRYERLERTPNKDPDPATHAYTVVIRDDATRQVVSLDFPCSAADDTDPIDFRTQFQAQYGVTYADNDWAPV